jgi:DNA polymerase III epsilon subunit-like protein
LLASRIAQSHRATLCRSIASILKRLVGRAHHIVAHNADFDRSFVSPALRALPWADSMSDIDWGRGKVGGSLTALALAHDVGVVSAHRAMADVDVLVRTFQAAQRLGADLPAMLTRALRPKVLVQALVIVRGREGLDLPHGPGSGPTPSKGS